MSSLAPITKEIISLCIEKASHTDPSYFYLMEVLVQARGGNFKNISREVISSNPPSSMPEKKKPAKLTATQIQIIERKRKKKMQSALVKLCMFPGNFRKMESTLGSKLHDIAREKKAYVQLENRMNTESMATNTSVTYVRVWGNPETIKSLGDRLKESAREAQQKVDAERQVEC